MLSLMELGLMDAEIDERAFETLRQNPVLNVRVINDDDLESLLVVKGKQGTMAALDEAAVPLPDIPDDTTVDWLTNSEETANATSAGLQTVWLQRLETAVKDLATRDPAAAKRIERLGDGLLGGGIYGIPLHSIKIDFTFSDVIFLTTGPHPLAFFSPVTSAPILLASAYIRPYILRFPTHKDSVSDISLPHIWTTLSPPTHTSLSVWRNLLETVVGLTMQRPGLSIDWLAKRFSTCATVPTPLGGGREREIIGVSFADVFSAARSLIDAGIVEVTTHGEAGPEGGRIGVAGWTLHPGKGKIWAGFR